MPKRTQFTNITPLPSNVTREVAIAMLHNHDEMIELNPMVVEHHPIKTPRDAPADEFLDCVWQELTDKVNYLPGGLVKGRVTYKACFHDLPSGLQTHIYAPTGLDIREKWSIGGTLPGEMPERREMGSNAPASGLYLQEECDMHCNRFLSSFVRKNLDEAHKVLVERILKKAFLIEQHRSNSLLDQQPTNPSQNYTLSKRSDTFSPTNFYNTGPSSLPNFQSSTQNTGFQPGSHMAQSKILRSPTLQSPVSYQQHRPQQSYPPPNLAEHPAFRNDQASRYASQQQQLAYHNRSISTNGASISSYNSYDSTTSSHQPQPSPGPRHIRQEFLAELPGSAPSPPPKDSSPENYLKTPRPNDYDAGSSNNSDSLRDNRYSVVSEMSSDVPPGGTDRGSIVSDLPVPGSPPAHYSQFQEQSQQPQHQSQQILMPYRYNPADFSSQR